MIIERSMSDGWLSNSYVIGDMPGGHAVLIDSGGPPAPILAAIEHHRLDVTHLLLTHHHEDHVVHDAQYVERFGCGGWGHPDERAYCPDIDHELHGGEELTCGELRIRVLHTPGHTTGMLAFYVNDQVVFTGDTLFKGTIGGTLAPGHASYEDLRHSIMEVLLKLPPAVRALPGHTDATTIGQEWEHNPFVRIWRGLDPEGDHECTAFGRPARLVLRAADHDGGTKCSVRFRDGDQDEIVPGSRVVGD